MAEPSHPTLPSTADTQPYAPVSWLAVAAMFVTATFVLSLLLAGYSAVKEKRPLLQEWMLVLPIAAIVLSFAARRVIRNSEGTRTGELFGVDLPSTAWWVSLVLLLGYGAYMLAIDVVIRREARGEVDKWVALIVDDKIPQAFDRTLPPGGRRRGEGQLRAEFREELLAFRNSDMVRVALRNKGDCTFVPGGIRDWQYKPTGIECVCTGTLRCKEGSFPIHVMLKAAEGVSGADVPAGRQWQVTPSPNYVQTSGVALTPYGHAVAELERQGTYFGQAFIRTFLEHGGLQYFAYKGFVEPGGDPGTCFRLMEPPQTQPRMAVVGSLGGEFGLPDDRLKEYKSAIRDRLFRLPPGLGDPADVQKDQFLKVWMRGAIVPAGMRLRAAVEPPTLIAITDTAVEVRVAIEMSIPGDESSTARGRVVVACTDPAVLAELKRLKASADPDKPSKGDEFRSRATPWRVVAIETDLVKVVQRTAPMPGGEQ